MSADSTYQGLTRLLASTLRLTVTITLTPTLTRLLASTLSLTVTLTLTPTSSLLTQRTRVGEVGLGDGFGVGTRVGAVGRKVGCDVC